MPVAALAQDDAEPMPLMDDLEQDLDPEFSDFASPAGGPTSRLRRYLTLPRLSLVGVAVLFVAVLLMPDTFKAHVGHDTVKLLQGRPSEVSSLESHCEKVGDYWCCYTQYLSCSPYCFPGEALASVDGKGEVALKNLNVDDRVLARQPTGDLQFEPVIGFLHKLEGTSNSSHQYVAIVHDDGQLRVSETHLVFVRTVQGTQSKTAANVAIGDEILVSAAPGMEPMAREVLAVRRGQRTQEGMVAPLTASGTVVIDGVVASVYASPAIHLQLPHSAAHAAFFLVRASEMLGLRHATASVGGKDYTHPFAAMLGTSLRLDRLLVKGA